MKVLVVVPHLRISSAFITVTKSHRASEPKQLVVSGSVISVRPDVLWILVFDSNLMSVCVVIFSLPSGLCSHRGRNRCYSPVDYLKMIVPMKWFEGCDLILYVGMFSFETWRHGVTLFSWQIFTETNIDIWYSMPYLPQNINRLKTRRNTMLHSASVSCCYLFIVTWYQTVGQQVFFTPSPWQSIERFLELSS